MIKIFTFSILLLLAITTQFTTAKADPCDSLELVYLGFNPFNPDEIIVYVHNTNINEIFDYPGFKLVNANGDTVASETVNFFGIAGYSAHKLTAALDNYVPGTVFNGTLLLYTGFYDSLVCTFPVSQVLIPSSGCTDFIVYTLNQWWAMDQVVHWTVVDETGSEVVSGIHDYLNFDASEYTDTVCLENGCYHLVIESEDTLTAPCDAGVQFLDYSIVMGVSLATGDTLGMLDFSVFYCDSTVGISDMHFAANKINLYPNPAADYITVSWQRDITVRAIELVDISGRVVLTHEVLDDTARIDLSQFAAGVYTARIFSASGVFSRKIIH
jgi:hypothetical protein